MLFNAKIAIEGINVDKRYCARYCMEIHPVDSIIQWIASSTLQTTRTRGINGYLETIRKTQQTARRE